MASATPQMPGHLIRRLHQISAQVFQRRVQEAGFDLTAVQFAALDLLGGNPGVDQARLATLIACDRATLGGVVERLEQKGLLRRIVSPRDRRSRELSLTAEGERVLAALLPVVRGLQAEILAPLSPEESREFLRLAAKAAGMEAP